MPPLWFLLITPSLSIVIFQYLEQRDKALKYIQAYQYCKEVGKPLLNVGCGYNPRIIGDVNIDIQQASILPNFRQVSIYDLPYGDKEFGAVCAFSVLEHLEHPQNALAEMERVANRVYVTVPYPLDWSLYFHPDHKYAFIGASMARINPIANWTIAGSIGIGLGLIYASTRGKT